jgi:MFS family permease
MTDRDPPPQPPPSGFDPPALPPETPPDVAPPSALARGLARARGLVIDITPLRRSRQFRLLWIGETVSDLGSRVTAVAVPYQVFRLTHSSLAVGMLALCELVPILVLPVVGGAVADRVDRRRLLRWTYGVLPLFSLVLAANAHLARPHLWVMYAFATLSTAAYALYSPAVRSAPPLLFERDELPAVFALTGIYYSFGSLVGPAFGGLLIATLGLTGTYLVDVASFAVALGTLAAMDPLPRAAEHEVPSRLLDSMREGLRFLKGRPVLQSTFTFDLNAMVFGMPNALFPAVADRLGGGPGLLGLLYAAPYGGAFLVTLLSGRARHVRRQGLAVMLSIVVWGGAIAAFGLSSAPWLALVTLAVAGGADMWSGIFRTSIAQAVVPDAMRGRLSGIELAVVASGPTLGDVEAGVVGSLVGVPFAIVTGGLACVAGVAVLGALVPEFARYDARHPTP